MLLSPIAAQIANQAAAAAAVLYSPSAGSNPGPSTSAGAGGLVGDDNSAIYRDYAALFSGQQPQQAPPPAHQSASAAHGGAYGGYAGDKYAQGFFLGI